MSLSIIHVTAGLSHKGFGVIRSVLGLAGAQGQLGHKVVVVGQKDPFTQTDMSSYPHLTIHSHRVLGPQRLGLSLSLLHDLQTLTQNLEIVHSHGLWMFPNWAAGMAARGGRRPLVISPRGFLDPWALAQHRWLKKILLSFLDGRDLRGAACINVLSTGELAALQLLNLRIPLALIPNGIDLALFADLPPAENFAAFFPQAQGRKIILFLSRLHPKKGLLELAQAWSRVAPDYPEWLLVIAGNQEQNAYLRQVACILQDKYCQGQTLCTGLLRGAQKLAALAAANAMILPSFSEGFPRSLLESLACRVPVLITPQCYFPEAIRAGAGIEISAPTVEATEIALRKMLSLSDQERREMGEQGRRLIEREYTWTNIAQKTIRLYEWLLGGGSPPEFVIMD